MDGPPPSRHRIQSVGRALTLHDVIAKHPGQTVKKLATLGGITEKTIRDYLATLVDAEWVLNDHGTFFVNPERRITEEDLRALSQVTNTLSASSSGMTANDLIAQTGVDPSRVRGALLAGIHAGLLRRDDEGRYATPVVRRQVHADVDAILTDFTETTGHDAALATLYQGKLVLTHLHKPIGRVSLLDAVTTDAAHATSAGHSLLHRLQPHQREEFLARSSGMRRFTSRTPTTPAQLELLLEPNTAGIYTAEGQYCVDGACLALGLRSGAPDGRCVAFTTSVLVHDLEAKREALQADLFRTAALLAPVVGPIPLSEISAGIQRMEGLP